MLPHILVALAVAATFLGSPQSGSVSAVSALPRPMDSFVLQNES